MVSCGKAISAGHNPLRFSVARPQDRHGHCRSKYRASRRCRNRGIRNPSPEIACARPTRGERGILEVAAPQVVIERRRVSGEVRLEQIEVCHPDRSPPPKRPCQPGACRRGSKHNRLRWRHPRTFHFLVVIERAGGRVVGHINIRASHRCPKSAVRTPKPYVPFARKMPAASETSVNVPSALL